MAQVRGIVQEGLGSSKRLQQLLGSLALPPQTLETLCSIHLPSPGSLEEFLGLQHRVHDALELLLGVELIRAAEMQPTPRLATCPHRLGGAETMLPALTWRRVQCSSFLSNHNLPSSEVATKTPRASLANGRKAILRSASGGMASSHNV